MGFFGGNSRPKGKSVVATSTPARNPDGGRLGDLESTHHAAMMDIANLSRSQRLLVADATRLAREGNENVAIRDATECARDGQSGAMPVDSIELLEVRSLAVSGGWRSDLPTALPIRKKRLEIFPRDIQKQVTEAKRMGTLPDLSAVLAAQLGLASGGGPSTAVPRAGEVPPSDAANTGGGRKRKRGNSGVEESAGEVSGVPLSGDPQKKKKRRKKTKRSVEVQSEDPEEPTGAEEEEEETQPEEEVSEAEVSRERDEAGEADGSEASLNAAVLDGSDEDSGESPLLMRRHNDEIDDEVRSPTLASPREGIPAITGAGAVQIGMSPRGSAVLRRAPGINFPDNVSFHYEGPAPLAYVPEKCGELLRQLRGRAKPLPAVKDLIFGSEYEEAARAKLLGDGAMNVVIDKYDTALKGVSTELELAKKEHAEKEEASARQLSTSKANVERLNGMVTRAIARRDELKADLVASRGGETPNRGTNAAEDGAPVLVLSDTSAEGSRRGNEEIVRESSVRVSELSALNDRESDRED
ncbi:hypothetical protein IGI04_040391 [Brassica rapa subsp. trilocularis]|uniref:Uncharacterized protein n=1 Tax=Brassica rapa subsp. trilocularis TaxID=1813537 RepID=A0ABQ7KMP9_BRACM|nr:hypothetical protein IGI04_040391 [Brassica rapa subsp. trilocularis]